MFYRHHHDSQGLASNEISLKSNYYYAKKAVIVMDSNRDFQNFLVFGALDVQYFYSLCSSGQKKYRIVLFIK